ncbi:MAG: hypothetical protein L0H75_03410 [Nitrosospira sp.]|nr:hypothetical protein [Nevskiaceae bacterium]MDN5935212.1 hypothetical protein [Nitrosospira sp.]
MRGQTFAIDPAIDRVEVTGERIRDKIDVDMTKGMGGPVPLGYDARNRMLVTNNQEAALVCRIFDDFVTVRSFTVMVRAYTAWATLFLLLLLSAQSARRFA